MGISRSSKSEEGSRFFISNKLPGDMIRNQNAEGTTFKLLFFMVK